jgi:beta-glucosidase
MSFPTGFIWGAAAAAYQIEGGADEDGRGMSVWDMFCRKDGAIFSGHDGRVACDHYHRWRDDVRLMKQLGMKAYRMSISWSRVLPEGVGQVNEAGMAFYDRLIDALLEAGITPYVTIFHWDYPYNLYCRGGWLNAESPLWFAEYTRVLAKRLGDRVKHWMTLNEPQCYLMLGHRLGVQAPGLKLAWMDVLRATHHSLLAHGRSVQMLREHCALEPEIGWAPIGEVRFPLVDDPDEVDLARARTMAADERNLWTNTLFSDPVCLGQYPEDALRTWGNDFPRHTQAELDLIHQPIDFYGLNIYRGHPIRRGPDGNAVAVETPGAPINAYHWAVEPASLYWGPVFLYERYGLPLYITENGFAGLDWIAVDGSVHDPQRIDFTHRYLHALQRAIAAGVDVRGYFHWSLLDNFEWADGYRQRFGLVHVDYQTQKRTPKDSAYWYASVIRNNGLLTDGEALPDDRREPHKQPSVTVSLRKPPRKVPAAPQLRNAP